MTPGAGNPIRVALVASTLGVGGAERVTADVLRRLSPARFDTRLFFLHEAGDTGRALFEAGFRGAERLARGRRDASALVRLVRRFHEFAPDVVVCLDHHNAMTLGRLAGIACGARAMVVASHATGLFGKAHMFGRSDRVLMAFTARVIAVSETHARFLRSREGLPVSSVTVIENGIDIGEFPPVDDVARAAARRSLGLDLSQPVILMIAAMRPEKAHESLLRAVASLRDRGRRATVLLAGDGERRGALEGLTASLALANDVHFLGIRRDVARLLHAADVVVLPSYGVVETLPLAVIEAMAVGIPVAASAVGSIPEIVRDGETGFLVPPGDDVALARCLTYILENPAASGRVGARGREMARGKYRIERTTARYEMLFEELVAA